MKSSTLSVIMCNYNYGHYIQESLGAILTQSFQPLEVIVVDDGSTDNSVSVVESLMQKYPNLRLLKNERNMGVNYSIDKALENVLGEYVYAASADDKVLPGFFEKSICLLFKYPEAGLCCAENAVLNGEVLINNNHYLGDKEYFFPDELIKVFLHEPFTPIMTGTVVVKTAALFEMGKYRSEFKWSCDTFAHHGIAFRYGICYVPEIFAVMREHPSQYGSSNAKKSEFERPVIKAMIEVLLNEAQYKDVLPRFKKVAPFSVYPWEVLMVVLSSMKYRGFLSFKLVRFALFDKFIRRPLLFLFPVPFCRFIARLARQSRYQILAFFGRFAHV
ncbi:MAG: glycosyltransferase family A protein [Candidatus Saganbacteria bacterium]|nr:glycosyltransferase family A protein [Candidatus Saganbacteria bacterium]